MTSYPGEVAVPAKEQAAQATDRFKANTSNRVKSELETRSTQVADQITPYAEAFRRAGHHIETQGSSTGGQAVGRVADELQQFSDYLRRSDADRFVSDVESFARRRPWAAGGIGVALGFLGARFLKASSETRYSTSYPSGTRNPVGDDTYSRDLPISRQPSESVGGW
jgi:hypothetical protein